MEGVNISEIICRCISRYTDKWCLERHILYEERKIAFCFDGDISDEKRHSMALIAWFINNC